MAYFQGLLLLVSGSVYVPGSKLPPISMSGRVTTPLVGFFVPYGFPIKDGMTIPHIATFDPGTNKHYKLTFMITLEVNHHIKKGVSFWMLINPYYRKWWLFKKPIKNGRWTSTENIQFYNTNSFFGLLVDLAHDA